MGFFVSVFLFVARYFQVNAYLDAFIVTARAIKYEKQANRRTNKHRKNVSSQSVPLVFIWLQNVQMCSRK